MPIFKFKKNNKSYEMTELELEEVDHKLHRKSSHWLEIIVNFSMADHYRRPKPFVFGIIDSRDSLLKVTIYNKDVNIDFPKISQHKMKKVIINYISIINWTDFSIMKLILYCALLYIQCNLKYHGLKIIQL